LDHPFIAKCNLHEGQAHVASLLAHGPSVSPPAAALAQMVLQQTRRMAGMLSHSASGISLTSAASSSGSGLSTTKPARVVEEEDDFVGDGDGAPVELVDSDHDDDNDEDDIGRPPDDDDDDHHDGNGNGSATTENGDQATSLPPRPLTLGPRRSSHHDRNESVQVLPANMLSNGKTDFDLPSP
jgi:hypothetical protein